MIFLREALFTSVRTVKTGMLVRPFVRKVITFCEEDMRGDHVPLDLGGLNDRFFGVEKFLKSFEKFWKVLKKNEKKCSKCTYQCGLLIAKIRFWTSHDQVWWTFGELFWTFLKLWKRVFWRGLRGYLGCSVRGRFYDLAWSKPVLRAPAVHGVSSIFFWFQKRKIEW